MQRLTLLLLLMAAIVLIAWPRSASQARDTADALLDPTVNFSSPTYTVGEGSGSATITVTLDVPSALTVAVDFATADGTAIAGNDYLTASGTLTFTPGITGQTFIVSILDDTLDELDETIALTLSHPTSGTLGSLQSATLAILDDDPSFVHLPLIVRNYGSACPTTSNNQYSGGTAYQREFDDPVRPAYDHADKNLELRGYTPNTDPDLKRELVDYGSGDPTQPPQLATLFIPHRVPTLSTFYRVHNWVWAPTPDPGSRGDPITSPPVTALGMQTTPGETLYVPTSGYDMGGGMKVLVLFADEDTVTLRYTRDDSSGFGGYTVHVDNICTDPNLLALYSSLDDPDGPRYVYVPPDNRPYAYDLPNLPAGQPIGTARSTIVVVAIVDTGVFQDTRSCNEWWQIRPDYAGTCPPARQMLHR
jgi:hypothetical protein